jgi:hypothetical protein
VICFNCQYFSRWLHNSAVSSPWYLPTSLLFSQQQRSTVVSMHQGSNLVTSKIQTQKTFRSTLRLMPYHKGYSVSLPWINLVCYYLHFLGKSPLLTWKSRERRKWNLAAVSVSSLISIVISGVTLARTQSSRPLMIIAGMRIVLGASIDIIHIHRMVSKDEGWIHSTSYWAVSLLVVSIISLYALYEFLASEDQFLCCALRTNSDIIVTHEDGRTRSIFKSIVLILLFAWIGITGLATLISFFACVSYGFRT